MKKVLSVVLCIVMIASMAIAASAAGLGSPSVSASEDLYVKGPEAAETTVTIVAPKAEATEVVEAMAEIDNANSIFDLVPMKAVKEALGVNVDGDISEEGLAVYTYFGIADNGATKNAEGKYEVTLAGLNTTSFRHFTFIYKTADIASTSADADTTLLASSDWKVLPAEDVTVNEDGSVSLAITSFGTYVMLTTNGDDLVNPITADSMWWIFVVAGVAVAGVAVVFVFSAKKKIEG